MNCLKVAIIGCGKFGSQMAEVFESLPSYEIVAVCDADPESAIRLAKRQGASAFTSLQSCLANSGADTVAVFTPNHLHASVTIEAARAGKHVFCEKPMALTVEECHAMLEAADRAGTKLMVGHKRRLRPQYLKMAEVVRSNRLGCILAVNVTGFYSREVQGWWASQATGGGLLPYSGVHDLDFLRSICGEAASVYARSPVKTDHRTDFEDAISLLIQFQSGVVATLQVCPFFPQRTFRQSFGIHIVMERGGILYDPVETVVHVQAANTPAENFKFDNDRGFQEAYRLELSNFADWVLKGSHPLLTGWDGLRCVELMEAAQLSAHSGKEVRLPLPRKEAKKAIFGPVSGRRSIGEPAVYARGLSMAEGPAFDREGSLYVANSRTDVVSRILSSREVQRFVSTGGKPQGVAVHPDGALLITDPVKQTIFRATPQGQLSPFCELYQGGKRLRGPNQIAFGPSGLLYFSDSSQSCEGRFHSAIARVGDNGMAELLTEGFNCANGLDFSPDEKSLYFAETLSGKVWRARLLPDGTLGDDLTEFHSFESGTRPGGIRFAANGELYVALFGDGQVAVLSPGGQEIDRLRVPGLFPTSVIFNETDLLVCEGQTGAIWRLPLGQEGMPSYAEKVWRMTGSPKR